MMATGAEQLEIKFYGAAMKAELLYWIENNQQEFESEQDALDQMNYWMESEVGRFMELVVK
mgnify:CR=1 FL=1